MNKLRIIIFIGIFFIILVTIKYAIGKNNFSYLKNFFDQDQKALIKSLISPVKTISNQKEIISRQKDTLLLQDKMFGYDFYIEQELRFKKKLKNITTMGYEEMKLNNNFSMKKYKFLEGFYSGISNKFPGSGYLDFHLNNLVVLSSRGILGYNSDKINDKVIFKQIKNNINSFINKEQYKKGKWFSLKDLAIYKNKIFISYTEEIKKNCWNTSVIFSEMNYENIKFKKLFSPKKCISSENNIDGNFNAHRSGGRIVALNDDYILLSNGEYGEAYLAQEKDNINGKIIKINIQNYEYENISMGHRNPQGLYFDKENNFVLLTEHGPQGGDEVNLIELDKLDKNNIPNYGWAIASYGEHYGGKIARNKLKYKKYPLLKSHLDNDFIEPLKSFNPAFGISEITKINDRSYVGSSLGGRSLYFFDLNKKNEIINLSTVKVFERVRDIIYSNKKLYLFLEDTASIGVIEISNP